MWEYYWSGQSHSSYWLKRKTQGGRERGREGEREHTSNFSRLECLHLLDVEIHN